MQKSLITCEAVLLCGFLDFLLLTASQVDAPEEDKARMVVEFAFAALARCCAEADSGDLGDLWQSSIGIFTSAQVPACLSVFEFA